jgi:hypothetical protein
MFAARNPIQQGPPVKEQNSRGKDIFRVRSLMSHDSLAESRNPNFEKQIHSPTISGKKKKIRNHQPLVR